MTLSISSNLCLKLAKQFKNSIRTLKNHCLVFCVSEPAIIFRLFQGTFFLLRIKLIKCSKLLTVVEVGQLSFLRAFAEAPVAGPGEEHAFPPVP